MDRDKNTFFVGGYPRSGNTFLEFVLSKTYGTQNVLRSHSTLDLAQNYDKDVCVVIRNPIQAIASWHQYRTQTGIHFDKNLSLEADFNYYLRFYKYVQKHFDQLLLLDFSQFSCNITYIQNKIESKYHRKLSVSLDIEALKKEMIVRGGANHLPRKANTSRKQIELQVLEHPLLKDATDLYKCLINKEACNDN